MRVAHVITRMILGGAQENTLLTCEDLRRDYGDDVLLVTGPALGPEGSLLERAERNGVPLAIIPKLRREIHPLNDAAAYRHLRRVLAEFQPDVVHTHSAKGGILGRAAAWNLGVPAIVHTVHGAPFHPYQSRTAQWLIARAERWAAARCHALVSVADAMTDQLVTSGVAPRERFTTIVSGMEVEPFLEADKHRQQMRGQLGYGPQDVVVGKIARLFRLKGHADVIEAAARLASSRPHLKFLFVGDGILRGELERDVERRGLADHVRFVGLVPPDELPAYLSAMDILVHASLREGLPRVLPQALLAGKPAISYDIDGAREVVRTGETGTLVRPRDIEALSRAIGELSDDASLRERLATTGRERCRELFRHERMTAEIRRLYERLLAGRAGAAARAEFVPPASAG